MRGQHGTQRQDELRRCRARVDPSARTGDRVSLLLTMPEALRPRSSASDVPERSELAKPALQGTRIATGYRWQFAAGLRVHAARVDPVFEDAKQTGQQMESG